MRGLEIETVNGLESAIKLRFPDTPKTVSILSNLLLLCWSVAILEETFWLLLLALSFLSLHPNRISGGSVIGRESD